MPTWTRGTDQSTEFTRRFLFRHGLTWEEADMFWEDMLATWQELALTSWDRSADVSTSFTR